MANAKLRLLLLSAGSLSAQNVIQALGPRRRRCVVVGTNSIADAGGNFRCDRVHLVPPAAAGADYLARLDALIRDEQPDLVIPTRDDDVLALAMLGEQSRTDAVLLTGSVASARLMGDKLATARFAERHALPFTPTAATAGEALELAAAHGLPLIGKPRFGYATRGVVVLRSNDEIERAFASQSDLIAQPFLDPPADLHALTAPFDAGLPTFFSFPTTLHSAQVIVGPDGSASTPFGSLPTQVDGIGTTMTRFHDPDLLAIGRAYAQAAAAEGWRGPLNVQLKPNSAGMLTGFEINGRFGGGTAARACMGFDEVGEAIRLFLPDAGFPAIEPCEADVVQRYRRSDPIPRTALAALRSDGRWSSNAVVAGAEGSGPPSKLGLLILGVGSDAAQAIIDAIGERRRRFVLIGMTDDAGSAGNFRCDRVILAQAEASYAERVAELIREEAPDLVIPTGADDVLALATVADRPAPARAALLTGTRAAARIVTDTLAAARFAARHGLPFAPTVDNARDAGVLAEAHGLPLIGKARSGASGALILRSQAEIERAFAVRPGLVAQPLLDPPANLAALIAPFEAGFPFVIAVPATVHSVSLVIGPDGGLSDRGLATIVTRRGTRLVRAETAEPFDVGRAFAQALAAEGWRGPLRVRLMPARDGRLTAFALDGFLGADTHARASLGSDDIAEIVRRFVPAADVPPLDAAEADVVDLTPYSHPVVRHGVAALRAGGRWADGAVR